MTEETEEEQDEVAEAAEISEPTPEEQVKEWEGKYLRALAEAENTRKRMQKERQDLTHFAIKDVICEFLHPIDSFEKALKFAETMSDEVKNWAVGFEMILGQFKEVLLNHGIRSYESVGKHFDPHLHDAVEMEESEESEPGVVLEEYLRGYMMGEKVIRVARVKVSKAPEPKNSDEKNSEE